MAINSAKTSSSSTNVVATVQYNAKTEQNKMKFRIEFFSFPNIQATITTEQEPKKTNNTNYIMKPKKFYTLD